MNAPLVPSIAHKMRLLNEQCQAVIFIITGPNGSGKTVFTKRLLTELPFHQTFNLGAVAKTIRYVYGDEKITRLENFTNKKTAGFFTPIVQFSCSEYQKNGVNVVVDGVQIDTGSKKWKGLITGGIVLNVEDELRVLRNQHPETHFNRAMELTLSDRIQYSSSEMFVTLDNNMSKEDTFSSILAVLSSQLDRQLLQHKSLTKQAKGATKEE